MNIYKSISLLIWFSVLILLTANKARSGVKKYLTVPIAISEPEVGIE
tara:strand:+ start:1250 stop:1390 length:141 start_codon:yes stop_codon:yes gene_type:complete